MKRIYFKLVLIFFCLVLSGCSAVSTRETVKISGGDVRISKGDETSSESQSTFSTSDSALAGEQKREERVLPDDSRLIAEFDGSGNKTETRTFPAGSNVDRVVVKTNAEGKVQAMVYTNGGAVMPVPAEIAPRVSTAAAIDILKSLDLAGKDQATASRPDMTVVATPGTGVVKTTDDKPTVSTRTVDSIQLPPLLKSTSRTE